MKEIFYLRVSVITSLFLAPLFEEGKELQVRVRCRQIIFMFYALFRVETAFLVCHSICWPFFALPCKNTLYHYGKSYSKLELAEDGVIAIFKSLVACNCAVHLYFDLLQRQVHMWQNLNI